MMTDPIADMLTRIRNAVMRHHDVVHVPLSQIKLEIASRLREEGFIRGFKIVGEKPFSQLRVALKYDGEEASIIHGLRRVSTPGKRVYVGREDIPKVKGGEGVTILSTSKGIVTDKKSRVLKVGGEVLCQVW